MILVGVYKRMIIKSLSYNRMQRLAHQGEENAWFTGNPYHSLFLHEPSMKQEYLQKSIEVPFDNPPPYGGTGTATLPVYGERITDLTLKLVLPQLETPITTLSWVYPTSNIVPPSIYVFLSNWSYDQVPTNQTVPFYSTLNLQWFPTQNSNVQLGVFENNFTFTYGPNVTYIGFLQDDAAFFGFDYFNALFRISVQAEEYIYCFETTPTSPLTFEQSGWIRGYYPPPLPLVYADSVATFVVRTASLVIGGQTIDTVTGEFIEIKNDVEIPYENQAALTLLTGKNDTSSIRAPRTYYVTLPFMKDIPIRDLYRHSVQVVVNFDTFYNITPNTSQRIGVGFAQSDSLVYFNYITGDNVTDIPGIPFNLVVPGYGTIRLGLVIDSIVWDGQYVYMFTHVTLLEFNQTVPYFIVFDLHKDIVTDPTASTLTLFSDYIQNESIVTIGKSLYAVGLTGSIYQTTMAGPIPLTLVPTSIAKVPLVAQPLFTHNVATLVPETPNVSYITIELDSAAYVSPGLGVPLSQTVYGIVAGVAGNYVTLAFLASGIDFIRLVASPVPAQTGVSMITIEFTDVTAIQLNQIVPLSKTLYGIVANITLNYVTLSFLAASNTPSIPAGTPLPFYNLVLVPTLPPGTPLGFYYPVSTYTLGTDGNYLYVTSTVNDSYAGPQYSNVFRFNISTYATSNLIPDNTFDVNFSTQPVFDGENMWYVDKYQLTYIYKYNVTTGAWTKYNYTTLTGVSQQNFSFSVFDGTYVYWFSDVTLTESLTVGGPVNAATDYWIRYNTKTDSWEAYNWLNPANGGFYTASMGLVNEYMMPSLDPSIKEALFDGRYINLTSRLSTVIIAYDTTLPFTSNASYTWFNHMTGTSSFNVSSSFQVPNPYGYGMTVGPMIYDGRFLFYLPYTSGFVDSTSNISVPAFILRYDTSPPVNPSLVNASLIVKYDKLPENTKLPNEYIITQTSMSQSRDDSIIMKTVSSGPVKEMYIVNQNIAIDPYDIVGIEDVIALSPYQYTPQASQIQLFFNNETILDYTTWILEPLTLHTTMPQRNVSFITFSFDPENTEPTGSVNFSRIRDIEMVYPIQNIAGVNSYTRVYTRNFNVLRVSNGMGGLLFNSPQWYDMSSVNGRWDVDTVAQIYVG